MRTKLLSSIVLGTMALAGVASADPIVRDHRYDPVVSVQPNVSFQARLRSRFHWNTRPAYQSNVNYGYQVDSDGAYIQPYSYGNDPYVEGIARGEWTSLAGGVQLAYNRDSQTSIDLGGERLRSLELQATGGRNFIREVHVELMDGRELKLNTNRTLDVITGPNMRLDLGGQANCGIRRIEVFGWSSGKGQFRVLGA